MTSASEIRDKFRRYFAERGHEVVASGPIVPANDPTLMFANAGMVQFKDVFTGQETRPYKRATSSQKCIRVSGKHNDLENVGVTARHHTFFEMLGNFSFGDYFKQDAIAYAWQFLTEVLKVPKERLVVTVFGGEGDLPADTEAEEIWHERAGLPKERILRLGAKDNFWSMGDTGPCGPCTEIHFFFGKSAPDLARFGDEPDEQGEGWVEIWNNVFMQFERLPGGKLVPLPAQSVDTGMGLERLACVVQGVVSNYDTDLLRPIVELAAKIAGKKYGATLSEDDVSMRVIADHARATAFLVAEGVFPDRDGRAYVLRRIMRRAIRHGHRLGIEKPFLHECALKVVELMGGEYAELRERRALIEQVVKQEEERFRATLKRGLERLSAAAFEKNASGARVLPGAVAFELYDTYGFPLDLQEVIGREQGFTVDMAGFERELERARERSAGSKVGEAAVEAVYKDIAKEGAMSGHARGTSRASGTLTDGRAPHVSHFLGYEVENARSGVRALMRGGEQVQTLAAGEVGEIITAQTPFYAESGGQVGDKGEIRIGGARFTVSDTVRPVEGLVVHRGKLEGGAISVGDEVELEVDRALRAATRRNHSATHLMHLALREVVGPHAMQKGSLVGPDRLRFDYSAGQALTAEQIARIEDLVNERILLNADVTTHVLPMAEAKQRGAIGIFEEKYGEVVRMLTIADSIELCGGTHVKRTGDIGAFKILSDSGIAAGVRRIEAATGMNALRYTRELEHELGEAAALLKASPRELTDKVQRLLDQRKEQARELEQVKRKLASGAGARDLASEAKQHDGMHVLGATVDAGDPKALRELADSLRDKLAPAVIALGSAAEDGRVLLVCTVSKELTKRFRAGDLIKELAGIVGGSGGGRPDFAQAGGNDPSKLGEAMARVYELVR
jgi:alanyl-tRNA synthetase